MGSQSQLRAAAARQVHVRVRVRLDPEPISARDCIFLALLTAAGILVSGYHYGVEDQAIWLAGVKKFLDPSLFPYDSQFFLAQTQFSIFSALVGTLVQWTGLSVKTMALVLHLLSVFLFLLGCLKLSRKCFHRRNARWGAVALVAMLLSLPVAGTALLLIGQYLHPRVLATVALIFGLNAVIERRLAAMGWAALAIALHPTLGLFGAVHLGVLAWPSFEWRWEFRPWKSVVPVSMLLPIVYSDAWREAMDGRRYVFLNRWTWYEMLGAFAPPLILLWLARSGRKINPPLFPHVARRMAITAILGMAAAIMIGSVPALQPLLAVETLRTLQLVYVMMFLLLGGTLAQYVLRRRPLRWLALFVPLSIALFLSQRAEFPSTGHFEWPWRSEGNAWLASFEWIRLNTPKHAYFALDPRYMESRGQDNHGFRVLAERGMMADDMKDRAVAGIDPSLSREWRAQVLDRKDWAHFTTNDFRRLRRNYQVDWVLLAQPHRPALSCPFRQSDIWVCRTPEGNETRIAGISSQSRQAVSF